MRLILLHPEVSHRPCGDCQRWLYHDQGSNFGPRVERPKGNPVPRLATQPTPCRFCPKIAPGDAPRPENAQELSPHNEEAYRHYLECAATGEFPADPIVRRNAAVIRGAVDAVERSDRQRFGLTLLNNLSRGL